MVLNYLNPACFFLISVSYKLAWTAVSSLLSQFSKQYGPQVLLQLNIAYFLPSIPVLILQTYGNDAMDRRLGGRSRGALVRFLLGLGGLVALTASFPSVATTHTQLLATTAAIGVAYGIAFGTSYQLAPCFPPICTVMLTTGFVSSGPLVLLLDLSIKRGPYYSPEGLAALFTYVSWITATGLLAAVFVTVVNMRLINDGVQPPHKITINLPIARGGSKEGARIGRAGRNGSQQGGSIGYGTGVSSVRYRSDPVLSDMAHDRGSSGGGPGSWSDQHAVMIDLMEGGGSKSAEGSGGGSLGSTGGGGGSGGGGYDVSTGKAAKPEIPMTTLAWRISPAMVAIFLSVGTSMLVFPYFTYMHSTGLLGDRLAQVLFYVRLVADVAGRLVPRRLQATTRGALLLWALIKTAMVPLMFACIFKPELVLGDMGAVVYVAVFWILSGYVNTCAYLVAPTLVPPHIKAKASGLMTVTFQSACFLALVGAATVQTVFIGGASAASATAH